jgi:hypothetical protein
MNDIKQLFRVIFLLFFFCLTAFAKTNIDLTLNSAVEIAINKYSRSLLKLMIHTYYDYENNQTVLEQFLASPSIERAK